MADEKLVVRNVYKVFGEEPDRALEMLKQGHSKDEILKQTGQTVGVQNTSFNVHKGEIFVVMGLSGSGKSTLVRMLNRLIDPTAGEIYIDGDPITGTDMETVRKIRLNKMSMVFQHFALFPHLTVAENVAYPLKIRGEDESTRRQKAMKSLEQVGLAAWADRPPSALSGGMQQRVGLARGLCAEPEVLLMDEPFSALDPLIRADMQKELLELQQAVHKTIVFITHDLDEALKMGDRIAIMKDGRIAQVGTPTEILTRPADDYVRSFVQNVDRTKVVPVRTVMREPGEEERRRLQNEERSVSPHTSIAEVLPMVLETEAPIAVRDTGDRLQGVITRESVMEEVSRNAENIQKTREASREAKRAKAA